MASSGNCLITREGNYLMARRVMPCVSFSIVPVVGVLMVVSISCNYASDNKRLVSCVSTKNCTIAGFHHCRAVF